MLLYGNEIGYYVSLCGFFLLFPEFDNQVDTVIIKELILHLVFVTFSLSHFLMIFVKRYSKIRWKGL